MLDYSHLIVSDLHGKRDENGKPIDISALLDDDHPIDVILCNGDIIDKRPWKQRYKDRKPYITDLHQELEKLNPKGMIFAVGNHENSCFEDEIQRKIPVGKRTETLISQLFITERYVGICDEGAVIPGNYQGKYTLYSVNSVPTKNLIKDENVKGTVLAHHSRSFPAFAKYGDFYTFGHYHRFYKDGQRISIKLTKVGKKGDIVTSPLYSYNLNSGKITGTTKMQTPGVCYFLNDSAAKIALVPGIYRDWMAVHGDSLHYWSRKHKHLHHINLNNLLNKVLKKEGRFGKGPNYTLV